VVNSSREEENEMKKFKCLLLIGVILNLALALALPATIGAAGVTVSVDASAEVVIGTDFVASVNITSMTNLDACNYDIIYDPSVINVTDVTSGLIGNTTIPIAMWGQSASVKIRIIEHIPGLSGVTGSGYLAQIHFHVIGTSGSTSTIAFSNGTLSSTSATEITATWTGDSINVIESLPMPTPTPTPIPCNATTPPVSVLTSPANRATGMNQMPRLAWNPSARTVSYSVQVSTVSTFATTVINQNGVTDTYLSVAPGVLNWNTRYYWRVRASNCGGTSAWSTARYFVTALGPPPADPTDLTDYAVSSSRIALAWTDNSSNETGFKIERKTGAGGTYRLIATVGINVTTYSNTGLAANTTYYYRICAYNSMGSSEYCTEASARTLPSPPSVPVLTSPANRATGINQTPRLAWNPSTGAVNYIVQVSTVSTFATTVVNQSGVTNTYFDVPGGTLNWNTRYYWRVNAVGASGSTSSWTTARYFRTPLGPY
jgi:hypothetical protein